MARNMKLMILDRDRTMVDFLQEHGLAVTRLFREYSGVDAELKAMHEHPLLY